MKLTDQKWHSDLNKEKRKAPGVSTSGFNWLHLQVVDTSNETALVM